MIFRFISTVFYFVSFRLANAKLCAIAATQLRESKESKIIIEEAEIEDDDSIEAFIKRLSIKESNL